MYQAAPYRHFFIWTLSLGVSLVSAGCRLLSVSDHAWQGPLGESGVKALTFQFEHDAWRVNPDWSPTQSAVSPGTRFRNPEQLRWLLSQTQQPKEPGIVPRGQSPDEPSQADSSKPPTAPSASVPADSKELPPEVSENLSAAELLQRMHDHGFANSNSADERTGGRLGELLSQLASRDDLVGWNAAIHWAQRDPAAAIEVVSVLEQLVVSPPSYDPETKKRVSPKDVSKTLPGSAQIGQIWDRLTRQETAANEKKAVPPKRKISVAMQAAAAEAWCLVLAKTKSDARDALATAGHVLQANLLQDQVQGELFLAIARSIPPADIPLLAEVFRADEDDDRENSQGATHDGLRKHAHAEAREHGTRRLRRAAIEACIVFAVIDRHRKLQETEGSPAAVIFDESQWPPSIWNLKLDSDAVVRRRFGQWLAAAQPPQAVEQLKTQLMDVDGKVRMAALSSLGELPTADARKELQLQADRKESPGRTTAIRGLVKWSPDAAARYLYDESFAARRAVAEGLTGLPTPKSALLLRELLSDPVIQVQQEVVQSIREWPDDLAIPILLQGLRVSSPHTRVRCFKQLRSRTGINGDTFDPRESNSELRIQGVTDLVRANDWPTDVLSRIQQQGQGRNSPEDTVHTAEVHAYLQDVTNGENAPRSPLYQTSLLRLRRLDEKDVSVIERFLAENPSANGTVVFQEVLPKLSPVYDALAELEHADVFERRRAAQTLASLGSTTSLSAAAIGRLRQTLLNEQDQLVWRFAMSAVMQDPSDEHAEVAVLALNNPWPDIQILGCRYLARHGRWKHAELIMRLGLLYSSNVNIQLAAIEAAGRCRNPIVLDDIDRSALGMQTKPGDPPIRGMRSLLTHVKLRVRNAAVVSMVQLDDERAIQEMVRMTNHESSKIRQQFVIEMGRSGKTRFVEHLIRLTWTESHDLVKVAILRSLDQLVLPAQKPTGLAAAKDIHERLDQWVDWWQERGTVVLPTPRLDASQSRGTRHTVENRGF